MLLYFSLLELEKSPQESTSAFFFFLRAHTLKGEVKVMKENAEIWIEVIITAATILLKQSSLY